MDRYDKNQGSDPPYSTVEKGEVENCSVTKYNDEVVRNSVFTVNSERERRLKSEPYVAQNFLEERNKGKINRFFSRLIILVLALIVLLILFRFLG